MEELNKYTILKSKFWRWQIRAFSSEDKISSKPELSPQNWEKTEAESKELERQQGEINGNLGHKALAGC